MEGKTFDKLMTEVTTLQSKIAKLTRLEDVTFKQADTCAAVGDSFAKTLKSFNIYEVAKEEEAE
jgi:outer membrane murein-binding lipoprotein Lpp